MTGIFQGCLNKLNDAFNNHLIYVAGAAVFLALVQVINVLG